MGRDWRINGETLVNVAFGAHISGGVFGISGNLGPVFNFSELGLAEREVRVTPTFYHTDVKCDDFGPDVAPEKLASLAYVDIRMVLYHYDDDILDACLSESMGGIFQALAPQGEQAGILQPCGIPMGGMIPLLSSGCHYISLNLSSPILGKPWRFQASHMTGPAVEIPLGADATLAVCNFRAIPYRSSLNPGFTTPFMSGAIGEISSSGVVLWDRGTDDPFVTGF